MSPECVQRLAPGEPPGAAMASPFASPFPGPSPARAAAGRPRGGAARGGDTWAIPSRSSRPAFPQTYSGRWSGPVVGVGRDRPGAAPRRAVLWVTAAGLQRGRRRTRACRRDEVGFPERLQRGSGTGCATALARLPAGPRVAPPLVSAHAWPDAACAAPPASFWHRRRRSVPNASIRGKEQNMPACGRKTWANSSVTQVWVTL